MVEWWDIGILEWWNDAMMVRLARGVYMPEVSV
jgi:hypothetical protein